MADTTNTWITCKKIILDIQSMECIVIDIDLFRQIFDYGEWRYQVIQTVYFANHPVKQAWLDAYDREDFATMRMIEHAGMTVVRNAFSKHPQPV